jgi:N-acetylglucosamine kinase-like BadF-type ATPase
VKKRSSVSRTAHALIVGIDGGNSKTDILLADTSGKLLAWVRVGGSNPQGIGLLPAAALLRSGIDAALTRAKRGGERPAAVALCMAGIDTPRDAKAVRGALAGRGSERIATSPRDTTLKLGCAWQPPTVLGLRLLVALA